MAADSSPGATAAPTHSLDLEALRARFPALQRMEAGYPVAYFDGPGGTQVPREVGEAITDHLYHHNGNRRWAYPASAETDAAVAGAREAMADFLGAGSDDVTFGPNMTTLAYHFSRSLAPRLQAGDEIVVTRLDHFANIAPWEVLVAERGVVLREVPFRPEDGTLDLDAFEAALGPRTRLVAIGWASNALGTVVDVDHLVRLARSRGIMTFVDAVHSAPHLLPNVRDLGCDVLACSPYKFYGPHSGVLCASSDLLNDLDVPRLTCAPQIAPERFETGTQSHEAMAGARAAVDFLASLGDGETRRARLESAFGVMHRNGQALVERMWTGLGEVPGVQVFGPDPGLPRTPTVSFTVHGHEARDVVGHLSSRYGIFASHGNFYAAHVPADLGVHGGLVRAGCAVYTTEAEVERLIEGVAALT